MNREEEIRRELSGIHNQILRFYAMVTEDLYKELAEIEARKPLSVTLPDGREFEYFFKNTGVI